MFLSFELCYSIKYDQSQKLYMNENELAVTNNTDF